MDSARQSFRLEKKGLREIRQAAARSDFQSESWIKLNISQTPPVNPEIFSRFGNLGKIRISQSIDGEMRVTECRQNEKITTYVYIKYRT